MSNATDGSQILTTLLDRLMAGLLNGPAMNCRPHNSRQRIDLNALGQFEGVDPTQMLRDLLGGEETAKLVVKTPKAAPRKFGAKAEKPADKPAESSTEKPIAEPRVDASALLTKIRNMAEDARIYQQDTGVHALALGFPLLALPPGTLGKEMNRRVLAPLAFIPIEVKFTRGVNTTVEINCYGDGIDRAVPNAALFAWLERMSGKSDLASAFEDATGNRPLREIVMLVAAAAKALELPVPTFVPPGHDQMPAEDAPDLALPDGFRLMSAPSGDENLNEPRILPAAVIGLFPMAKQGLIQDMKWLAEHGAPDGPVASFLKAGLALDRAVPPPLPSQQATAPSVGPVVDVALVGDADPCQRAVIRVAQKNAGTVIHGPPGTGKSQTIVNLISDHLARGQRVLFVCDKRTALDVVLNRMTFAGLGDLCAVVHDPQADQKDLYRAVREQLESLVEPDKRPRSEFSQTRIDQELSELKQRLTKHHNALMKPATPNGKCFSDLVGEWYSISGDVPATDAVIPLAQLDEQAEPLNALFDRAASSGYAQNAWAGLATTDLAGFLARPVAEIRAAASTLSAALIASDSTLKPGMPAFDPTFDLAKQATARAALAESIARVASIPADQRAKLAAMDQAALQRLQGRLNEVRPSLAAIASTPLDLQLSATAKPLNLTIPQLNQQSAALQAYIDSTKSMLGGLAFGRKSEAKAILAPFGLSLDAGSATKLKAALDGLKDRLQLTYLQRDLAGQPAPLHAGEIASDESLSRDLAGYDALGAAFTAIATDRSLISLRDVLAKSIANDEALRSLADALKASPARAEAIRTALTAVDVSKLISPAGVATLKAALYQNQPLESRATQMNASADTLENVVRIEKTLADTPEAIRKAAAGLLASGQSPAAGLAALRKQSLAAEIRSRIVADASLQAVDARDLKTMADRVVALEKQGQTTVRDAILDAWIGRAKSRLLEDKQVSKLGSDTKRRFLMTGKNAMRLRTVIQLGQTIKDGDPLFDLKPVWMASPETVAQLFAKAPVFDAVIFDEASQLRLEEALPVLLRAKRVIIAGDEKQLPPTRFFESTSGNDDEDAGEITSDQQLFESQQATIEDLLAASLHLQIQEAYLDVHYRSKNADLIEFSNRYFYGSRLQALPTPPAKQPKEPPVKLIRADGTYDTGENEIEAKKVVEIVKALLAKPTPPSIGIACMNVQMRDVILEALDEAADTDETFAKQLDTARNRTGKGGFEGLFVKNLENVQGDERDQMIIATTYGPDAKGKFYERFGPLQMQGGGRRLNVLVTRAREQVHLVTSIPATRYQTLPPVPQGSQPTGGWLLYAYLKFADELAQKYASGVTNVAKTGDSPRATALAKTLATKTAALAGYGNDGFCVDLATLSEDGKGVLIDSTRFTNTDDPAGWDIFRANTLANQGWKLERLWTPHFFRDPEGELKRVIG